MHSDPTVHLILQIFALVTMIIAAVNWADIPPSPRRPISWMCTSFSFLIASLIW